MGRAIVTQADVRAARDRKAAKKGGTTLGPTDVEAKAAPTEEKADGYLDRLVKYIPADVIAFYLAVQAGVAQLDSLAQKRITAWIVFLFFLGATAVWLRKQGVARTAQIVVSMLAFAVWAFATSGGPLSGTDAGAKIAAQYGPIIVPMFTFAAAIVEPEEKAKEKPKDGGAAAPA
jgi:hypothetical protein